MSWINDVFVSFRGEDTRASFTSHLYASFQNAGINVFRDDDMLQRGSDVSSSLVRAIEGSRISVIVFSRNYASSKWCLRELEKIMECHGTIGQVVLPVFYDVDPSEVRDQKGCIAEAFARHSERFSKEDETVNCWRKALHEASVLPGVVANYSRNESDVIKGIVDNVINVLVETDLFIADNLVGVESRAQHVIQLLSSQRSKDTLIIGIWGIGGIGKTTIAKSVYNKIRRDFEAMCFLSNVREVWKQDNDKVSLQRRLISFIYKTTIDDIDTVESGKVILQKRLRQRKIFLVLDDVNKLEQLNALCGSHEWFGRGSRILITTRNMQILSQLKVDHVYKIKEMDANESLELFCRHAFEQPCPGEGYVDLSREFVMYCGGLPLALKVIGTFLFDKSKIEWKNAREKLKIIPHDIIMENLRTSFDDLSDNEKKIFLDITFFFIGMNQDDVIQILEHSGYSAEVGILVLVEQSLITVDSMKRIGMHNLIQGMGKEIIRQKSTSTAKAMMYHVFLNFRGEDSRAKFISHLYGSLENAGLDVFRDDDEIQRGDQVSISLLQAIGLSRISIVVLSKNYANSRWCMLELENIMESRRTGGLVVVPVFYGVDPSEVRHQTGEFGDAFKNLLSRMSVNEQMESNWKVALLEVGGIAGEVIINSK